MIRLFIKTGLFENAEIGLDGSQAHYLHNIMRLSSGDKVSIFNGEHGEWNAVIKTIGKKGAVIVLGEQIREQIIEPDVWLLFSPIKRSAIDLLVEKATELGVSVLWPIATRRSNVSRVNVGRLSSIAKEASEQCERLTVPRVFSPEGFDRMLLSWKKDRKLYYLDETGGGVPIKDVLLQEKRKGEPAAFLIGSECGFEKAELKK
ncbi:MAG: 16S rRNA (uracil(1498)-N(3))-methyltransferase, partial [Alphaproteobacteria bacterium]|nr:16S rRNA (uracil(1498)-N(3))-methyltransferase [Alphaproteobacteria bacterium]